MKKYITLAALLTAGAAFANAETALVTTFDNKTSDSIDLLLSGIEGATGSYTSGTEFMTSGKAAGLDYFLTPNANVGLGTSWTEGFSYNIGESTLSVSEITLDVGLFSSSGAWQSQNVKRYFDFEATLMNEAQTYTFKCIDFGIIGKGDNADTAENTRQEVVLKLDPSSQSLLGIIGNFTLSLKVTQGDSNNNQGCYVGLNSITMAIPEPSAFGLLAGLGALALVGARRRRK